MSIIDLRTPPTAELTPTPTPTPTPTLTPVTPATWLTTYARALVFGDLAAATLASVLALWVRFGGRPLRPQEAALALVVPPAWLACLALGRAYEPRFLGTGSEEHRRVFNAAVRLTVAVALVAYGVQAMFPRGYVVLALPLATALSLLLRVAARRWLARERRQGRRVHRVLLLGGEDSVVDLVAAMRSAAGTGYDVVGACVTGGGLSRRLAEADVGVFGGLTELREALRRTHADTVAVTPSHHLSPAELRQLSWDLEGSGVALLLSPVLADVAGPRIHIRPVCGLPLLHVEEPELSGARHLAKALLDRSVAAVALLLLAPLLLAVAVGVRVSSPGPALFRQQRVGRDGGTFTLLKFRSMYGDAEARLADLAGRNERSDGLLFKVRADPRVTRLGRVLRRLSIDELPQLINVLRGQMSLVGPRPPLPTEVARYGDDVRRRLLVKPGLTGLWQVSGRSDLAWEESVRLDLHYVENWSLTLDLMILAKTARAVLASRGAY